MRFNKQMVDRLHMKPSQYFSSGKGISDKKKSTSEIFCENLIICTYQEQPFYKFLLSEVFGLSCAETEWYRIKNVGYISESFGKQGNQQLTRTFKCNQRIKEN